MAFIGYHVFGTTPVVQRCTPFVHRKCLTFHAAKKKSKRSVFIEATLDDTEEQQRELKWSNIELKFISKTLCVDGRTCVQLREHIEEVLNAEGEPVRWAIVEASEEDGTCRVDAVVTTT